VQETQLMISSHKPNYNPMRSMINVRKAINLHDESLSHRLQLRHDPPTVVFTVDLQELYFGTLADANGIYERPV
jgi:hypothetical protein